jgi:glycosyltransferase involved in cell wall biosynthesis
MENKIQVSVIICTWNRDETLRKTLDSLNNQDMDLPCDVEVIIVDNNSKDNTKKIVDEFSTRWKLGELKYIFEPRQGKQFALNNGIINSRYAVLAFTDDDIFFPKYWIHEIYHVFEKNKNIDLAGGKTLIEWPVTGQPKWYHPSMEAVLGGIDLGPERIDYAPENYAPAGANLIVRRSLIQRIGAFSETHFRHMDFEFGMRSHREKAHVAYEPSIVVSAPVDSACLTKRYFRRWAFKAGIMPDSGQQNLKTFLKVPKWIYRQLIEDIAYTIIRPNLRDSPDFFVRELRAWRNSGKIISAWHEIIYPKTHQKWIERYSQKKKNLY